MPMTVPVKVGAVFCMDGKEICLGNLGILRNSHELILCDSAFFFSLIGNYFPLDISILYRITGRGFGISPWGFSA